MTFPPDSLCSITIQTSYVLDGPCPFLLRCAVSWHCWEVMLAFFSSEINGQEMVLNQNLKPVSDVVGIATSQIQAKTWLKKNNLPLFLSWEFSGTQDFYRIISHRLLKTINGGILRIEVKEMLLCNGKQMWQEYRNVDSSVGWKIA